MRRGAFHALDGSREREMMMGAPPMLELAQQKCISTPYNLSGSWAIRQFYDYGGMIPAFQASNLPGATQISMGFESQYQTFIVMQWAMAQLFMLPS